MYSASVARVQAFFDAHNTGLQVIEPDGDTATVQAAAATLGVEPDQIAKTLAIRAGGEVLLLVMSGESRLDNARFRRQFGSKPRMLPAGEALEITGQPVGGVSPFGHINPVPVYCDESLRKFDIVYPAAGSPTSAVRITPSQLAGLTAATWVDVARQPLDTPDG